MTIQKRLLVYFAEKRNVLDVMHMYFYSNIHRIKFGQISTKEKIKIFKAYRLIPYNYQKQTQRCKEKNSKVIGDRLRGALFFRSCSFAFVLTILLILSFSQQ